MASSKYLNQYQERQPIEKAAPKLSFTTILILLMISLNVFVWSAYSLLPYPYTQTWLHTCVGLAAMGCALGLALTMCTWITEE